MIYIKHTFVHLYWYVVFTNNNLFLK